MQAWEYSKVLGHLHVKLNTGSGKVESCAGHAIAPIARSFTYEDADGNDIALNDALQKSGADLLVNARITAKMTKYFLFDLCSTSVTGTAATMEVGMQDLSGG